MRGFLRLVAIGCGVGLVGCSGGDPYNDAAVRTDSAPGGDVASDRAPIDAPRESGADVIQSVDAADARDVSSEPPGPDAGADASLDAAPDAPAETGALDAPAESSVLDAVTTEPAPEASTCVADATALAADAGAGTSCDTAIPIRPAPAARCPMVFTGDTCAGAVVPSSCGARQAIIFAVDVTETTIFSVRVTPGFAIAALPGIPFCGGPGACVGEGTTTGLAAGMPRFYAVMSATDGTCGPFTFTFTPM